MTAACGNEVARPAAQAGQRLLAAVAVSVLLHSAVLLGMQSEAPERGSLTVLRARIIPVSAPESAVAALPQTSEPLPEAVGSRHPERVPDRPADGAPAIETAGAGDTVQAANPLAIYHAPQDVDVRAKPKDVSNRSRQEAGMMLGRVVRVKLALFISASGTVDRFDIVESEGLTPGVSLDEVHEIRFHPALRNGLPVASRKTVELSFVP